jgi:hypothetical protein
MRVATIAALLLAMGVPQASPSGVMLHAALHDGAPGAVATAAGVSGPTSWQATVPERSHGNRHGQHVDTID